MKDCNQCGKCCIKYGGSGGLSASESEIEYWDIFRSDISEYVSEGKIWVDPKTDLPLTQCPWLRKTPNKNIYTCDIYHDRPDDCKYYPVTLVEMIRDECEMIEPRDITNPKQAQINLDQLMADSRPPSQN